MALVRILWKWVLRLSFILWLLILLLVVLKFYKDNPGGISLQVYNLAIEVPTFVLGILPLLLLAMVLALSVWVAMLRLKIGRLQRRADRYSKALKAISHKG